MALESSADRSIILENKVNHMERVLHPTRTDFQIPEKVDSSLGTFRHNKCFFWKIVIIPELNSTYALQG